MRSKQQGKCVVIGLGASGMAAVRYLHARGWQVAVSEAGEEERISKTDLAMLRQLGVDLECGGHTPGFFHAADMLVPSPGVPLDLPVITRARRAGALVAGELALAAGKFESPVIGITGSNGKTTTTALIGHLLQADGRRVFVGGNIGTPVLEYLNSRQDAETVVLELSSFQLEMSGNFRPDIGLLLNLSPDHLDRHGSMAAYAAAKQRIFLHQQPADTAIINGDDPLVAAGLHFTAGTVLRFGSRSGSQALVTGEGVLLTGMIGGSSVHEEYCLQNTALAAEINRQNAAAAILAARTAGCSREGVEKGLAGFRLPLHRMAPVAEVNGVQYIDDSKGTNIGAVAAALASCGERVVLIAGGRSKGEDFSLLAPAISRHVQHLILIGEAAEKMTEQLGALVPVSRAATMEEAVRLAAQAARPGDTVLLSPGCASFDMFSGYAQRGEIFTQAVNSLAMVHQNCC